MSYQIFFKRSLMQFRVYASWSVMKQLMLWVEKILRIVVSHSKAKLSMFIFFKILCSHHVLMSKPLFKEASMLRVHIWHWRTFAFPLGFPFEGSKCKYTEKTPMIRFLFLGGRKNGTFPSPRFAPKVDTGVTGTPQDTATLIMWW